jgi:hypothetical protein
MTVAIAGSLVWIRIPQPRKGGALVTPEKWPIDAPGGVTAGRVVVAEHKLSPGEFSLSIAILEQRYPPPAEIEAAP